jgi:hypothetical protein
MYKLLNIPTVGNPHKLTTFGWLNVNKYLKINIEKATDYYQRARPFINARHILFRFLSSLPISQRLSTQDYYNNIRSSILNKSTVYGMTSSYSFGQIHSGNFYGDDKEVILAVNGSHDPFFVERNWRSVKPITILRHDYSDFDYQLIRGMKKNTPGGVSVIMIDLTLLALQYKAFKNEEELKSSNSEYVDYEQKDTMNFLSMYPLNAALNSHMDQVLINNYHKFLNDGLRALQGQYRVHFNVLPLEQQTDRMVFESTRQIKHNSKGVYESLASIPLNDLDNASQWLILPETLMNKQCLWAYMYSKLPTLKLGIVLGGEFTKARNAVWTANYIRLYRRIKSDGVFSNPNLKSIKDKLETEFSEIVDLLKY